MKVQTPIRFKSGIQDILLFRVAISILQEKPPFSDHGMGIHPIAELSITPLEIVTVSVLNSWVIIPMPLLPETE